jgi:hypothetical protein
MKPRYIIFLFGLLALATLSACEAEPIEYVSYVSQLGVAFEYPEAWIVEETETEIKLVSRAELLTGDAYASGATVDIFAGPAGDFQGDLVTILSEVVALMAEQRTTEVVTGATAVRINDQDAATVTLAGQEGETPIRMTAQVVMNDDRIAYLITIHDLEADKTLGPILEHIRNSIVVGQSLE